MSTISRRRFLGNAGVLGAGAVLAEGALRSARADKPINFSGWVFKPDTVKDYVDFYNKKHGGQVKYEAIPWTAYHPTMETRAFAGEIVDVMYCNHNNRERWYENGLIRPVDDLPGTDELKKKMTPANLDSLKSKDGSKLLGLPYFTSLFVLIYNEPMLQQAGIKAPGQELGRAGRALHEAQAGQGQRHSVPAQLEQQPVGDHAPVHDRLLLRGGERLRRQEPGDRGPGARGGAGHGALAEGLQGGAGEPRGPHQDLVHRHPPALLDRALRLPHQPLVLPEDDRGGARELEARPQEGQDGDVPGDRSDLHVDRLLRPERQEQGARGRVEAHEVPGREPERGLARPAAVVPDLGPRQPVPRDVRPSRDHPVLRSVDRPQAPARAVQEGARSSPPTRSPGTASTTPRRWPPCTISSGARRRCPRA